MKENDLLKKFNDELNIIAENAIKEVKDYYDNLGDDIMDIENQVEETRDVYIKVKNVAPKDEDYLFQFLDNEGYDYKDAPSAVVMLCDDMAQSWLDTIFANMGIPEKKMEHLMEAHVHAASKEIEQFINTEENVKAVEHIMDRYMENVDIE